MTGRGIATPSDQTTFVDLLRWRAQDEGDRAAYTFLVDGERETLSLTYACLDRRAREVAAVLQDQELSGRHAIVLCPPGLEYLVAFFGCQYAGAAPVTGTADLLTGSVDTLRATLHSSSSVAVLTTTAMEGAVEGLLLDTPELGGLHWIYVDALAADAAGRWREPAIGPGDICWLCMTSGSTGTPKTVVWEHGAMLRAVGVTQRCLEVSSQDILLSWLPFHISMNVLTNVSQPVIAGTPLVFMAPEHFGARPARWLEAISSFGATITVAPNFAYDLCARVVSPSDSPGLDLTSLQVAFSGGETIRPDTLDAFTRVFAPYGFQRRAFFQGYGITETMLISTGARGAIPVQARFDPSALEARQVISTTAPGAQSLISIGTIPNAHRVEIVDPVSRTRVEDGRVGEIWLSSPTLARGYWNRPEETEATFKGTLATGEGPYYRTGDLGFFHEGELFICGREKELIIIRGRNFYPISLEASAERSHRAIRRGASAAFAIEHENTEGLVMVHEIDSAHGDTDLAGVLNAVRVSVVSDHMIQPDHVILVPPGAIPKTAGGKVQRHACRAAYLSGSLPVLAESRREDASSREEQYAAPRTEVEARLAAIWAEVLRTERVGIHDNYFELGGDSLLSMQVIARANAAGLGLSVAQLFAAPTVAELAALAGTGDRIEAEQGLVSGPVPLSPRQRRFFANHPVSPGERPDFEQLVPGLLVELREALDPVLLEEAVGALLRHHDALRLRFHAHDGVWEQHNAAEETGQVVWVVDLATEDVEEQTRRIRATRDQLQRNVSLSQGPLIGVALFLLGPERPDRLMLLIHHLVQDGFSTRLLWEDLETAYRQLEAGRPIQLPAKTTSFKHWAERLLDYAQSPALAQEADYWLDERRMQSPPLPLDHPDGANLALASRRIVVTLDPDETQTLLREVPRLAGTEINDVLLTGLVHAFRDWTGSSRLLVDLKAHGRDQFMPGIDVSRTVGWFTTVYPMLLDIDGITDPLAALQSIKEQLRTVPSRGMGYAILRYLRQDPALLAPFSRLPRPPVSFNYQGQLDQVSDGSTLVAGIAELVGSRFVQEADSYHFAVGGGILRNRMNLVLKYNQNVFDRETIERVGELYLQPYGDCWQRWNRSECERRASGED